MVSTSPCRCFLHLAPPAKLCQNYQCFVGKVGVLDTRTNSSLPWEKLGAFSWSYGSGSEAGLWQVGVWISLPALVSLVLCSPGVQEPFNYFLNFLQRKFVCELLLNQCLWGDRGSRASYSTIWQTALHIFPNIFFKSILKSGLFKFKKQTNIFLK